MKKIITLLLIACIFITGCGKTSMKDVQQNLENAENYQANVDLRIKGTFNKERIDYKRTKTIKIDNINGTAKVNANVLLNDETYKETYYIKTNKDTAITYKLVDGNYQQHQESKDQNSIYYITAFINQNSTIIQQEKNKLGTEYVIKLEKNRVISFLNSYYDVSFLNEDNIIVDKDVLIHLDVDKSGYAKKLEADFENAIRYNVSNYDIDDFKLIINYSKYNKNKNILIPDEILTNSLDAKLTTIRQYAIDYVKGVNDLKLGSTTYTNTLGYSIESAELTIVDNIVQYGNIAINNYNIKIINGEIGIPEKIG